MRSLLLVVAAGCAHPHVPPHAAIARAACAAEPAEDLSHLTGVKVAHVDVRGEVAEPAALAPLIETRPGTPFDPDTLRGDIRRLWKLGLASQIAVTAEPSPEGYAIELVIEPPPHVRAVEIEGVRRDQLATFTILEGTLHDPARLARLAAAATQWWRAHGYLHADVVAHAQVACGEATVHVTASLGRRYTLAYLGVTGSVLSAPASLFEHDLGATNRVGGVFRADVFAEDVDALVTRHHRAGWLDATTEAFTSHADDETGRVTAAARVVPGRRYRFGPVAIKGGTAAQRKAVVDVLAPLRGRWYDADALDDAYRRLDDRLEALGPSSRWETGQVNANQVYDLEVMFSEPAR